MAERPPSHRSEQTGNPALDRIQNNVRELIQFAKQFLVRVLGMERAHGTGKVAIVRIRDEDMTLSDAHFDAAFWLFTGTLTAARTVTIPRGTDDTAYGRVVFNFTTGGFAVTLKNQDGTDAIANNMGGQLIVYGSYGPELWI